MLERIAGNEELKSSIRRMLEGRRLTHSVLLVGEAGLGAGFAARCVAADYLYPQGGAPAEALLRGECCRAVAKAGKRDSGQIETGIVREAFPSPAWGPAGGIWSVRSRPCGRRSSTPAFRLRAVPSCSTMWSG